MVQIRLADNSEGNIIEKLTNENGFTLEGLDWSTVYPYWLVVEHESEIVGTVQVCLGRPVGRLEFLSTKKEIDGRLRASTVKRLLSAGNTMLKESGAQLSLSAIPFEMKSHKKILKKQDSWVMTNGNVMVAWV